MRFTHACLVQVLMERSCDALCNKLSSTSLPYIILFRILLQDDNITETAKTILNWWIKTTENVPGCQALRKKIGHILFGFRVVYGETIFVIVTPNRRNSALLLYLSRTRSNDTCFKTGRNIDKSIVISTVQISSANTALQRMKMALRFVWKSRYLP